MHHEGTQFSEMKNEVSRGLFNALLAFLYTSVRLLVNAWKTYVESRRDEEGLLRSSSLQRPRSLK